MLTCEHASSQINESHPNVDKGNQAADSDSKLPVPNRKAIIVHDQEERPVRGRVRQQGREGVSQETDTRTTQREGPKGG
jgi:hypothetical protein